MSVIVIVKRVFRMDHTQKLVPLLKQLREESSKRPGYISRTTYSKISDPGELIVIAEWESVEDWMNWMNTEESRELQWQIDSIIGEKTTFEVYRPEEY
ncbi:MAG: antibiotic biosynthesis monooxygenase [Desulfofustis sp. PB-SRB1]|nr:antibiotic biosynthesis monooxygenase [Desulfofustis sp. PB-SRB1]MBM1004282.1 antibiotic biosynthesis monooxygenase [Desulfofustis sp. PB-SRB1]HBH30287.1 antibiotic biosynthesis monooxygenase [Desulfofustis sp.]